VQYEKDDRIERQDFLGEFGFQASTENRARKQGLPWPPHVVLGKRIYYSRQAVQQWFEQQEANTAGAVVDDQWLRKSRPTPRRRRPISKTPAPAKQPIPQMASEVRGSVKASTPVPIPGC
jgi:hypothetical protein